MSEFILNHKTLLNFLVVWSPAMCCASVQVPDALFFLGVLFAVGGLERVGLLKAAPCKVTMKSMKLEKLAVNRVELPGICRAVERPCTIRCLGSDLSWAFGS